MQDVQDVQDVQETVTMPTISENVIKFKETKNPFYLLKAIYMVIRRGRTHELLYGMYCKWVHAPSKVRPNEDVDEILEHFHENIMLYKREFLTKPQLKEIYGDQFAIDKLPDVFGGSRSESITVTDDRLILGEYDEDDNSSRIAILTADSCEINDHYMDTSGIRHIHSIHNYEDGKLLVATGDRLKVLDLWTINNPDKEKNKVISKENHWVFSQRLIRFLAGYTAMKRINGDFYFGTDFSSRPNYIEMENRKKYFFPEPAYMMYVMNFNVYKDRYLMSLNSSLDEYGSGKTLSIFDTKTKEFVYCDVVKLPK